MLSRRKFNKLLLGSVALSLAASNSLASVGMPKNKKEL